MNRERIEKSIKRLNSKIAELEEKYNGKEQQYTFWAGWDLGYFKGKRDVLEDWLDEE